MQILNEHDEEGRSLPEELTENDVGRRVLRRATVDDSAWIEELFGAKAIKSRAVAKSPLNVLLLRRAIALHEDPSIGYAVLHVGFSMRQGKLLRLSQMASQSHVPKERFIECLSPSVTCMDCLLDTSSMLETTFTSLRKGSVRQIAASHLPLMSSQESKEDEPHSRRTWSRPTGKMSRSLEETLVSEQEENESHEDRVITHLAIQI